MSKLMLWPDNRQDLLHRHDFFVEQTKRRVLRGFDDIVDEANEYADAEYERLGSLPSFGGGDMSDVADTAWDRAVEHFMMLSALRTQTTLGALASLYHQWEKDFRSFLDLSLSGFIAKPRRKALCWGEPIERLFDKLEASGWPLRKTAWYPLIDACRLVVNVHKHGEGPSLEQLVESHPHYFRGPFDTLSGDSDPWRRFVDYRGLAVSEDQFDEIAAALRRFWIEFPEEICPKGF